MMGRFSLKQKIVYTTILSGVVGGLILGSVVFLYLRDVLVKEKLQEIRKLSIEQSHETNVILERNSLFAKMLSENSAVKEFLADQSDSNKQELANVLFGYTKEDPKYLALYVLDKNGLALVSTDPRFVGQDYSFRDYYKKSIVGEPWTEVFLGKMTNQVGYFFSYPVYDNGNIIGVLVVKTSTEEIDESVINSEIDKVGTTMLTDQYGVIIYSNREGRFLKSLGQLSASEMKELDDSDKFLDQKIEPLQYGIVQSIVRNYTKEQAVKFNDKDDGDQEIISLVKIGNFPFYLVTESPLDKVEGMVLSTIIFLLAIIFLLMAIFAVAVYRLIVIFISPLNKLKVFAQAVSAGDFSKTIEIKSADEFSSLAEILNKMAKDLQDLYANLDNKVKDKTLEIEDKNDDLDKQKMALLNVLEDVEEEKNKTISLAKDLEKFKLAVDHASDHIVITDEEG